MEQPIKITSKIKLRDFNPSYHAGMDKDKAREKTDKLCGQIAELQHRLYANRKHALLIVLQGMDTSGKDGASKRVLEYVTPAGVEIANFKTPSSEELAHDYLWRIHKAMPRYGNVGVFNRSHYEDVLVVRVLNLQPRAVWQARYSQINAFERLLVQNNVIILKFFLHITKAEQARRLQARLTDSTKKWKFELNDIKMRAYWRQFQRAYEDAINLCNTPNARWHIVPANHKWFRDYVIAKAVVDALKALNMKWPRPKEHLASIRVK